LAVHTGAYIEKIKKDIIVYGKLPNALKQSNLIQDLKDTLDLQFKNLKFNWQDILNSLCNTIKSVVIREVHQQSKVVPLEYRNDINTNAIVIGGTSLSRGYTLEGLNVSYFLRNTVFYDTLMQMGRWFGYRADYQDLCKIYMPETMIDNFGYIIEATEDLFADFKKMSKENRTPKDFGLAVKQHPDSILQVTARNKQRNIKSFEHSMCLDGLSKEANRLSNDKSIRKGNLSAIEGVINKLQTNNKAESIGNDYLWRDVNKDIIIYFLNNFKVYQNDTHGIVSRMPVDFIKKYAENVNTNWDVAIYNGIGKKENIDGVKFKREQRKARLDNDCVKVQKKGHFSASISESIVLDKKARKALGYKRQEIRKKLEKPLLRLHILETTVYKRLAAFGVSFPTNIKSGTQNIRLKINTVYYQNLLKFTEYEDQADD
jgi:hypothetical protein